MNQFSKSAILLSVLLSASTAVQALEAASKKSSASNAPSAAASSSSTAASDAPTPAADAAASAASAALAARSAALAGRIRDYKANPDPSTWDPLLKELREYAQLPLTARVSEAALLKGNPGLADLGTKVIDFSGGRIWNFTRVPECQHLLLQWQNVTPGAEEAVVVRGKRRIVRGPSQVAFRAEYIHIPPGVQIKEARIVGSSSVTTVGKKVVRTDSVRSLILVGNERGGSSYLHAFRPSAGTWNEVVDVFNGVPPYVLQNLSGKASFSGNDLILALGGTGASDSGDKKAGAPAPAASNGYRIVLKLIGGKYTLEGGKNGEEGPMAVMAQFSSALAQNRPDMAKAWLADPALVSIPKYIGYFTKTNAAPRIVPMANPGNGFTRFRLITSLKDDLIVDVGRSKTLPFAISHLFIAPPDPLAAKIFSNMQPKETASAVSGSGESSAPVRKTGPGAQASKDDSVK